MKRIGILALALALAVSFAACGASGASAKSSAAMATGGSYNDAYDVAATEESGNYAEVGESNGVFVEAQERKIILTADLSIEALDFDAVCAALEQAAADADGYVSNSYVEGREGQSRRYASYTFRVPAANYREFLTSASGAGNLISKTESEEDITLQYVDTEARIASLEAQRDSLNEMLENATDVETLITIRTELSDVQYQLESYQAQKRVMDNQVEYTTVNVSVREVLRETENPESFADRLATGLADGWYDFNSGLMDVAVALVYLLPWIIVIAAIVAAAVVVARRSKKKRASAPPPALKPGTDEALKK